MRILIIIFIFFSYYSSLNANEIFNLIKIPNLEVFNLDSKNKIKYLSLKKSFTIGTTKNITCDKANESNLKKKYEIIKKNLDIYNYQFLKKTMSDLLYYVKIYLYQVLVQQVSLIYKKEL